MADRSDKELLAAAADTIEALSEVVGVILQFAAGGIAIPQTDKILALLAKAANENISLVASLRTAADAIQDTEPAGDVSE